MKRENIEAAETMKKALENFSQNPAAVDNFINYLEQHFTVWMQKHASTPDGLANEFFCFSTIE